MCVAISYSGIRMTASGQDSALRHCRSLDRSWLVIQSLASERLKSTRAGSSTSECAIRTHDLEQTFASPFRAPVNRRSRGPALVTHSGRAASQNTSARSRACGMVGFAIPIPEGSNPEGKELDAGPTARLLADAELGPRAEIMRRSGHGDRTHYIRHHHD